MQQRSYAFYVAFQGETKEAQLVCLHANLILSLYLLRIIRNCTCQYWFRIRKMLRKWYVTT